MSSQKCLLTRGSSAEAPSPCGPAPSPPFPQAPALRRAALSPWPVTQKPHPASAPQGGQMGPSSLPQLPMRKRPGRQRGGRVASGGQGSGLSSCPQPQPSLLSPVGWTREALLCPGQEGDLSSTSTFHDVQGSGDWTGQQWPRGPWGPSAQHGDSG